MGKYRKGYRITSLNELAEQEFVFCNHKITHKGWFLSWPVRLANEYISRGSLFTAIKIESEENRL